MEILSQRDAKWKNIKLGTSNTTIGDYGCTVTCLAMIIGVTPIIVNDRLKAVEGFSNGNLIIWAKIEEAFPGIKVTRVWSYNNDDVLAHVPNVLVEVPAAPIGGTGSHWVVYLGNKKLNDPWTGKERPTSDFPNPTGYCIITGKWKEGEPTPMPNPSPEKPPETAPISDSTRIHIGINPETSHDYGDPMVSEIRNIIFGYEHQRDDLQKQLTDCQGLVVDLQNKLTKIAASTTISPSGQTPSKPANSPSTKSSWWDFLGQILGNVKKPNAS